jgi:hypothetical protein
MKTVFKNLFAVVLITVMSVSCSKSDSGGSSNSNCLSGSLTFKQTEVKDFAGVSNSIYVTFDVKNTSTKDYSLTSAGAGNFIFYKIKVKTTDGTIYETKGPFTDGISAGATKSISVPGEYGAGKVYESYTIELYCGNV